MLGEVPNCYPFKHSNVFGTSNACLGRVFLSRPVIIHNTAKLNIHVLNFVPMPCNRSINYVINLNSSDIYIKVAHQLTVYYCRVYSQLVVHLRDSIFLPALFLDMIWVSDPCLAWFVDRER